jgi:hypothetical protein
VKEKTARQQQTRNTTWGKIEAFCKQAGWLESQLLDVACIFGTEKDFLDTQ